MKILRMKVHEAAAVSRTFFTLAREEFALRIQLVWAAATVLLGAYVRLTEIEWLVVILTIGAVIAVELCNTAIEELCDHVTPEMHPQIAKTKEVAASASAAIGIAAIVVGLIIFVPHLAALL